MALRTFIHQESFDFDDLDGRYMSRKSRCATFILWLTRINFHSSQMNQSTILEE